MGSAVTCASFLCVFQVQALLIRFIYKLLLINLKIYEARKRRDDAVATIVCGLQIYMSAKT